jgi:hypothetical protein
MRLYVPSVTLVEKRTLEQIFFIDIFARGLE